MFVRFDSNKLNQPSYGDESTELNCVLCVTIKNAAGSQFFVGMRACCPEPRRYVEVELFRNVFISHHRFSFLIGCK